MLWGFPTLSMGVERLHDSKKNMRCCDFACWVAESVDHSTVSTVCLRSRKQRLLAGIRFRGSLIALSYMAYTMMQCWVCWARFVSRAPSVQKIKSNTAAWILARVNVQGKCVTAVHARKSILSCKQTGLCLLLSVVIFTPSVTGQSLPPSTDS